MGESTPPRTYAAARRAARARLPRYAAAAATSSSGFVTPAPDEGVADNDQVDEIQVAGQVEECLRR